MLRATAAVLIATAVCAAVGGADASQAPFLYLALGDSSTASVPSFVDGAAARAAASLHRKVTVQRLVEENEVAALEAMVASSPKVSWTADLITVMIGVNQLVHVAYSNGCAASACAKAERAFEREYASLLDRLTALRPASKTAYRLLTEYNLPGVFHGPTATAFTATCSPRTALSAHRHTPAE